MAVVTVKLTCTDAGAKLRAHLNGVALAFSSGKASKTISAGEHALTWYVYASPGSDYALEVKSGAKPLFNHTATIDGSMIDGGIQWITV